MLYWQQCVLQWVTSTYDYTAACLDGGFDKLLIDITLLQSLFKQGYFEISCLFPVFHQDWTWSSPSAGFQQSRRSQALESKTTDSPLGPGVGSWLGQAGLCQWEPPGCSESRAACMGPWCTQILVAACEELLLSLSPVCWKGASVGLMASSFAGLPLQTEDASLRCAHFIFSYFLLNCISIALGKLKKTIWGM